VAHFCKVVNLELRTVLFGTALIAGLARQVVHCNVAAVLLRARFYHTAAGLSVTCECNDEEISGDE
jgi:hypothetical protein